jgi:hypothetical protein
MKAFRGSLLAAGAVALLGGAWVALRPAEDATKAKAPAKVEGEKLFPFEKADLAKIEVRRPEGTLTLEERADGWWIAGDERRASRSMVSRVKHQLHDLSARATVVPDAGEASRYGLGASAIQVTLTMRDGSTVRFAAGDPNPTGVSFYIQREGDARVFTVKKSAVDYYALGLEEFRERRFATFDSKDVDMIDATLPDGKRLAFQRSGPEAWTLREPARFDAELQEVMQLLGRVSALKAIRFVDDAGRAPAEFGLDAPRTRVTLKFAGREPLTLLVGKRLGERDGDYELAYAAIEGEPGVYAVRDDLVAEWSADPERFRLRRFVRVADADVAGVRCTLTRDAVPDEPALAGTSGARNEADTWTWDDGMPVAGSTPRRVVGHATSLEASRFESATEDDARYGFASPRARVDLALRDGATRSVLIGKRGPEREVPPPPDAAPGTPPRALPQAWARTADHPEVYLVDETLIDVCRDLRREASRKAESDAQKSERHERIEKERSGGEGPR